MKTLPLIACAILISPGEFCSAPPEPGKTSPAVPAKPYFRFMAYVGDSTRPDDMRFQLNTPVSRSRRRSSFFKLGEVVLGTKYKLTKFEFKTRQNAEGGVDDVSEVTLEHLDTEEETVLVLGER